jgi:hypothetical protein
LTAATATDATLVSGAQAGDGVVTITFTAPTTTTTTTTPMVVASPNFTG